MPLLKETAEKLSNNELAQGVIEEIITEDELFDVLDFKPVTGKAYVYNREKTLPEAEFVDVNDTIQESAGDVEEVTARVRAIVGDTDVDDFLDEQDGDENDQTAIQVGMRVKATARKYRNALINGAALSAVIEGAAPAGFITGQEVSDAAGKGKGLVELDYVGAATSKLRYTAPGDAAGDWVVIPADGWYVLRSDSPSRYVRLKIDVSEVGAADATFYVTGVETKAFEGLERMVDPSQIIVAGGEGGNGGVLTWDLLDQLMDACRTGADAVIMNEREIRKYRALLRASGGETAATVMMENFGKPMLTLHGKPVLKNNYIKTTQVQGNAVNASSIFAVKLGDQGLQGLHSPRNAGIVLKPVGVVQNKDAMRYRVKWYASAALKCTLSLAAIKGVIPA
jgi:hypothetical protein